MDDQTRAEQNTVGEMTRDETEPAQSAPGNATHDGQQEDIPEQPEEPQEASPQAALQNEIERLRAEATANLDGWQRARAEFANYKKRSETERQQQMILTGVRIIEKLLPVIDDFNRALANLPEELQDNGWVEGVRLTQRKLFGVLEDEGVKEIAVTAGDKFDPVIHEAISHEESDKFEEGQIIAELQKGYRIGERVLRPALVRVAR